jgi:hypothetical protein
MSNSFAGCAFRRRWLQTGDTIPNRRTTRVMSPTQCPLTVLYGAGGRTCRFFFSYPRGVLPGGRSRDGFGARFWSGCQPGLAPGFGAGLTSGVASSNTASGFLSDASNNGLSSCLSHWLRSHLSPCLSCRAGSWAASRCGIAHGFVLDFRRAVLPAGEGWFGCSQRSERWQAVGHAARFLLPGA